MTSTSSTRSAMYLKDGEEIVRFVRHSHHVIKNILDKVSHRKTRVEKKKCIRDKKISKVKRYSQSDEYYVGDSCSLPSPNQTVFSPTTSTTSTSTTSCVTPPKCFSEVPFDYFSKNLYEDEELSVENLLPSLTSVMMASPPEYPVQLYSTPNSTVTSLTTGCSQQSSPPYYSLDRNNNPGFHGSCY